METVETVAQGIQFIRYRCLAAPFAFMNSYYLHASGNGRRKDNFAACHIETVFVLHTDYVCYEQSAWCAGTCYDTVYIGNYGSLYRFFYFQKKEINELIA